MADPLFADGWGEVADRVVQGGLTVATLLDELPPEERERARLLMASHSDDLAVIAAAATPARSSRSDELPDILSATSLVRLKKGDLTAWDLTRPLPSRPTIQRRVGTEVHRLIEERARGLAAYPNETEMDEPDKFPEPGLIAQLLANFEASGYAERELVVLPSGEPMVELPFTMRHEGRLVRGRIDAVYRAPDGGIEIVDFKTGSRAGFENPDPDDQLSLYARALRANGLIPLGEPVKLTYLFLDGEPPLSRSLA
jgi:DNA helicase II / ATP-dependent DNA helicase PcrA